MVRERAVLSTMTMRSSAVTPTESVTRTVNEYVPAAALELIVMTPVLESIVNPDGAETIEKVLVPVPPPAVTAERFLLNPAVLVSSAGAVMVRALFTVNETVTLSVNPNASVRVTPNE